MPGDDPRESLLRADAAHPEHEDPNAPRPGYEDMVRKLCLTSMAFIVAEYMLSVWLVKLGHSQSPLTAYATMALFSFTSFHWQRCLLEREAASFQWQRRLLKHPLRCWADSEGNSGELPWYDVRFLHVGQGELTEGVLKEKCKEVFKEYHDPKDPAKIFGVELGCTKWTYSSWSSLLPAVELLSSGYALGQTFSEGVWMPRERQIFEESWSETLFPFIGRMGLPGLFWCCYMTNLTLSVFLTLFFSCLLRWRRTIPDAIDAADCSNLTLLSEVIIKWVEKFAPGLTGRGCWIFVKGVCSSGWRLWLKISTLALVWGNLSWSQIMNMILPIMISFASTAMLLCTEWERGAKMVREAQAKSGWFFGGLSHVHLLGLVQMGAVVLVAIQLLICLIHFGGVFVCRRTHILNTYPWPHCMQTV